VHPILDSFYSFNSWTRVDTQVPFQGVEVSASSLEGGGKWQNERKKGDWGCLRWSLVGAHEESEGQFVDFPSAMTSYHQRKRFCDTKHRVFQKSETLKCHLNCLHTSCDGDGGCRCGPMCPERTLWVRAFDSPMQPYGTMPLITRRALASRVRVKQKMQVLELQYSLGYNLTIFGACLRVWEKNEFSLWSFVLSPSLFHSLIPFPTK
jgi:hypothetical protein